MQIPKVILAQHKVKCVIQFGSGGRRITFTLFWWWPRWKRVGNE